MKRNKMKTEKQYFAFNKSTGLWWDGQYGFNLMSREVEGRETKIPQSAIPFMNAVWNNPEYVEV